MMGKFLKNVTSKQLLFSTFKLRLYFEIFEQQSTLRTDRLWHLVGKEFVSHTLDVFVVKVWVRITIYELIEMWVFLVLSMQEN